MGKIDFSTRLRTIIEQRNIRQSDLCKKTGIKKSAMSQYLSGSFSPKQQNLHKLATALNVSEAWLMGYDVPMERSPAFAQEKNFFYLEAEDDSMVGACIPQGASVLIEKDTPLHSQQIVACMIGTTVMLRRLKCVNENIVLFPENSNYEPLFFAQKDLEDEAFSILGVAKQVVIDL